MIRYFWTVDKSIEAAIPYVYIFFSCKQNVNFINYFFRMSLVKNIKPLTKLPPRPVITWDKHERIQRNKEIWANKESVVHRLPEYYQQQYWKDLLSDAKPVHYRPIEHRFYWDEKRKIELEAEVRYCN